ncbi:MAG: ABC transporter permease [Bacteroidales bacterium]|nr:ABC transporter permease [Bacteroidales bacterium]
MLRNYFLIAFRNLVRQKSLSFINILGLSLGLACTILILFWVLDELNYDRFHENIDNLYRVEENQHYSSGVYHVNVTPYPSGPVWKEGIPEIQNATRLNWVGGLLFQVGDKYFYENNLKAVDSTFFEMFTFPMIHGNPETALNEPFSIVLTNELAEKYFDTDNPIGQSITVNNQYQFTVRGVVNKVPKNSWIQYDALVPFDFLKEINQYNDSWGSNSITTFVELNKDADLVKVDTMLTNIARENNPQSNTDFLVAPMKRMHLYSYFGYGHSPGNIQYVYIFSILAIFVLLIACINFMNLSTARSVNRSNEIGVRKVVGAFRKNLIGQFFGESILMAIVSTILALVWVQLISGVFNNISGKEIVFGDYMNYQFLMALAIVTILTGLISGTYPALYLSRFKPIQVLKGQTSTGSKGSSIFRQILVVFQFSISIFLVIGTVVIYNQLNFMRNKKVGYDKEMLMYVPLRGETQPNYHIIRDAFLKESSVLSVTGTTHSPSMIGSNTGGVEWPGKDPDLDFLASYNIVDFNYAKTFGIEMKEGRDFSPDFPGDLIQSFDDTIGNFLINEKLAKLIDKPDILGSELNVWGFSGQIVGIMRDFHFKSVREDVEPMFVIVTDTAGYINNMVMRLDPKQFASTTKKLEAIWNEIMPGYPFDYKFVNDDIDRMYRTEERMGSLVKYLAILAVIIACLGLFGLASYTAEQRTKEIGIRKVMGATQALVVELLSRRFALLVFISALLACPLAWFAMRKFLQEYHTKTSLDWWIFVGAALLALIIAQITISYQAIKAANTNPAEALRYE